MLIGNKNCDKCGSSYDVARDTCPACNTPNEEKQNNKSLRSILFLSPEKQLILLLIGFGVLQLFGFLMSFVLEKLGMSDEDVLFHFILNVSGYLLIAIAMSLVIFKDFKLFKTYLKRPWTYLFGFAGGIILIMVTLTYSFCTNLMIPHSVNDNQSVANAMMIKFPISSILLIGIIGPICEEFTYRLGLYSFLRRINKYLAYAVTIVFFALIHINFFSSDIVSELISIPQYLFAGFTFCFLYEKWGISASVTAHVTNNLFSVIIIILQQLILLVNGTSS